MKNTMGFKIFWSLGLILVLYLNIVGAIFQWKNPKANKACLARHFWSVITLEKLEQYQ